MAVTRETTLSTQSARIIAAAAAEEHIHRSLVVGPMRSQTMRAVRARVLAAHALRAIYGLTYAEIGAILGMHLSTVCARLKQTEVPAEFIERMRARV